MDASNGLFAGLAGVTLDSAEYPLGHGIKLSQTYAHLMAPFMMAFERAAPGKRHTGFISAVRGGLGFDLEVQLEVPAGAITSLGMPPEYLIWCLTALLRLRVGPHFVLPAVGEQSFAEAKVNDNTAVYYAAEIEPHTLKITADTLRVVAETDAAWVAKYWIQASALCQTSDSFQLLLEAVDQSIFARHRGLALLWLWGGLEAIFSPDKAELRYRISSAIASFLEPAGISRMNAQKVISRLYDSRSAAAHGREDKKMDSLQETYTIARRAVMKMIEDNRVPTHAELEARLFGADPR